ncbi:hypothetical protein BofuT4_P018530.1 [Botrytis cinerea T4]|uniref:Uncharacterized protein n=1 Tax=Botryotinia fuckeliana (strain T4) TaxID=999810 RepID=G2YIL0_BOTF4|nr:hypothetical protein BofuT4_P018530.1 [Botrytis cinerea T4]
MEPVLLCFVCNKPRISVLKAVCVAIIYCQSFRGIGLILRAVGFVPRPQL